MDTISTQHAPPLRTVRLRAVLALGAVAVAGAFGAGYILAQQLDEPARMAVTANSGAHTFGDAVVESLAVKQAPVAPARADIRMSRIR